MKSLLIASILANAAMAYTMHGIYQNNENANADNTHMLTQRLAVLEVENYIESRQPWRNVIERRGYAEIIVDAANEFGQPPLAVARVAMIESGLDHRAIGDSGKAIGVMQIHAKWWVGTVPFVRTAKDLRNPQTNIRAGAWILRHYAERCGTEPEKYFACFNGGETPNEQARAYARKVVER
jgi:soluble lytic murein transglycosylase-like protein